MPGPVPDMPPEAAAPIEGVQAGADIPPAMEEPMFPPAFMLPLAAVPMLPPAFMLPLEVEPMVPPALVEPWPDMAPEVVVLWSVVVGWVIVVVVDWAAADPAISVRAAAAVSIRDMVMMDSLVPRWPG